VKTTTTRPRVSHKKKRPLARFQAEEFSEGAIHWAVFEWTV